MQILWIFSPPSPLPLPWIISVLTSRLLREKSGRFSLSILMSCPRMVFQPLLQSMGFFTTSLRSLVLLSLPRPTTWNQTSSPPPKLSSSRWRWLALYIGPPHPGPVLFTWSLSLMGPGGLVGTSADSTPPQSLTGTLCPPLLISPER